MIFVLDNYDSFTYNLVHLLYSLEPDIVVRRNRSVTVKDVLAMEPEAIVLSHRADRKTPGSCLI